MQCPVCAVQHADKGSQRTRVTNLKCAVPLALGERKQKERSGRRLNLIYSYLSHLITKFSTVIRVCW